MSLRCSVRMELTCQMLRPRWRQCSWTFCSTGPSRPSCQCCSDSCWLSCFSTPDGSLSELVFKLCLLQCHTHEEQCQTTSSDADRTFLPPPDRDPSGVMPGRSGLSAAHQKNRFGRNWIGYSLVLTRPRLIDVCLSALSLKSHTRKTSLHYKCKTFMSCLFLDGGKKSKLRLFHDYLLPFENSNVGIFSPLNIWGKML